MLKRFQSDLEGHQRRAGGRQGDEVRELQRILEHATVGDLLDLLKETLGDAERLRRAADYGYRHANGFLKLTLMRTDACALRVHVWEPGMRRAENAHSHRWGFASRVLVGAVEETRFEIAADGEPTNEFGYMRLGNSSVGQLTATRLVNLRETHDLRHPENDLYTMSTPDIHRINDGESKDGGVTLVLTGSSREPNSRVFSPASRLPVADEPNNDVTVDYAADAIGSLIGKLS